MSKNHNVNQLMVNVLSDAATFEYQYLSDNSKPITFNWTCCSEDKKLQKLTNICPFVNEVDEILGKLGPQLCTMKGNLNTIFQLVQQLIKHKVSFSSCMIALDIITDKHLSVRDAIPRLKYTINA